MWDVSFKGEIKSNRIRSRVQDFNGSICSTKSLADLQPGDMEGVNRSLVILGFLLVTPRLLPNLPTKRPFTEALIKPEQALVLAYVKLTYRKIKPYRHSICEPEVVRGTLWSGSKI